MLEAPADGSVIGSFVIGVPVVGRKIGIGIEEDSFVPVGIFLTYPFVLAAAGDAPYANMAELAAYAQDNDVVLGHLGAGLASTAASMAAATLMDFEFADDAAFDLLDCNTLSSGDADVINTTLALVEPCLGGIKILANIGEDPIAKLDGVAILAAQSGVSDLELWNGRFVTKGTPQEAIWDTAHAAGLPIESMNGEYDNGQFELTPGVAEALRACDDAFLFRTMAREIAAQRGHLLTFLPKSIPDRGGSGLHINVSFTDQSGTNVIGPDGTLSDLAQGCVAGLIHHHEGLSGLLAPTVMSYDRRRR